MVAYSLDPVFVEQLDFFDEFAIKKKLMSTEFIPLTGYDIEMMSEEVVEAVKAKRLTVIIAAAKAVISFENLIRSLHNKIYG